MNLTQHHAYIVKGDVLQLFEKLESELGVSEKTPHNLYTKTIETFGIGDARELLYEQSKKSVNELPKVFVYIFDTITNEAQNALLKVCEEPTENSYIFLSSHSSRFLDTLLSRVFILEFPHTQTLEEEAVDVELFFSSPPSKRIELLQEYIKEKNKKQITLFLDSLERYLYKHKKEEGVAMLKEVIFVREYLYDKGASVKLLLEHLCLA